LEELLLEVGISNNLHDLPYSKLSCLATSSLVKSTWNFLSTHDLTLKYEIKIPPSRINDQPIMKLFIDTSTPIDDLLQINRCRLYLRAFYLSDITDGFGTQLSEDAWMGRRVASSKDLSRPAQGMPPRSDWELWRKYLKLAVLSRGMRLKHPLGEWITDTALDTWYIDPRSDQLHRKLGSVWYLHSRIPRRSGRPMYSSTGTICDLPPVVHKAQVLYRNQYLICNGHCSIQAPVLPNRNSFMEFLFSSTEPSAHWCFESICLLLDDGYQLAQSIRNNLASINALKAVTDGSFQDTFGTTAWILECSETSQ